MKTFTVSRFTPSVCIASAVSGASNRAMNASMKMMNKILRADDEDELAQEFVGHARLAKMRRNWAYDGDSEIKAACRDGNHDQLATLLSAIHDVPLQVALGIACQYARPACVQLLLDRGFEPEHLVEALRSACRAPSAPPSFDLDSRRPEVIRLLLKQKRIWQKQRG